MSKKFIDGFTLKITITLLFSLASMLFVSHHPCAFISIGDGPCGTVGGWPIKFTELHYKSDYPFRYLTNEERELNRKKLWPDSPSTIIIFSNWHQVYEYEEFFFLLFLLNSVFWFFIANIFLKIHSKRKFFWKNRKKIAKITTLLFVLLSMLFAISYIRHFTFKNKKTSPFIEACKNLNGKLLSETTITDYITGFDTERSDPKDFSEFSLKKSLENGRSINIHEAESKWSNLNYWVCRIENENGVLKTKSFFMY